MYALIVQFDVDPDFQTSSSSPRCGTAGTPRLPNRHAPLRADRGCPAPEPFLSLRKLCRSGDVRDPRTGEPFKEFIEAIQGHADDPRFLAIGDVVDPETHTF
jgi:hypothetical protein